MNSILLTFDVEDWFQVENFKDYIPFSSWPAKEQRVRTNTAALLDLLDEIPTQVHATFFILGWVAERFPDIVKDISIRGHEIASHGYNHDLCYTQSPDELLDDLIRSKQILEDITGQPVLGYRAPSFSITDEALKMVQKAGYIYDSSYNSFGQHGRYGSITLPYENKLIQPIYKVADDFYEIPVSNLQLYGRIIPWSGGGYFRFLPSFLHNLGVKHILNTTGCYTFYLHPWEIDPQQPKVEEAKLLFRLRHYLNLKRTTKKFAAFTTSKTNEAFLSCSEYLKLTKKN